jgi:hypothetical protein
MTTEIQKSLIAINAINFLIVTRRVNAINTAQPYSKLTFAACCATALSASFSQTNAE